MVFDEGPFSRMASARQQRASHEDADRAAGHKRVEKLLERINFEALSTADKIARLHTMSPDDFYVMLSHLNGNLRNLPAKDYQHRSPSTGDDIILDKEDQNISYIVPPHGRQLFDEFFARTKDTISEENLSRFAVKLQYAIAFAHPFEDGNGRTSRYVRRLLFGSKPEEKDFETTLRSYGRPTAVALMEMATFELFQQELSEEDRKHTRVNFPDDVRDYVFAISKNIRDYEYAHALQALALRKTFPDVDVLDLITTTEYYESLEKDPEAKTRFDAIYAELQSKLFWKVQEIIDKEPDVDRLAYNLHDRVKQMYNESRRKLGMPEF